MFLLVPYSLNQWVRVCEGLGVCQLPWQLLTLSQGKHSTTIPSSPESHTPHRRLFRNISLVHLLGLASSIQISRLFWNPITQTRQSTCNEPSFTSVHCDTPNQHKCLAHDWNHVHSNTGEGNTGWLVNSRLCMAPFPDTADIEQLVHFWVE